MEILIIIILILLNGLFSMSEIALISSRKFRLENAAKKGNGNARKALQLSENPTRFLSTVQIGITLIGILTGIYSGEEITDKMEAAIARMPALQPYADELAVLAIVIIITFLSIVFGELIPKRIGLLFPESIAMVVARPMNILSKIVSPFIWLLTLTNDFVLRIFGIKANMEGKVTEEEIKAIVQQGAEGGEIRAIEQDIVHRVFALGDRKAHELMTHRTDIVWLDVNDPVEVIKEKIKEPHSIYLVADGTLDKLAGAVSVKEMFSSTFDGQGFVLNNHVKKPLVVHENTPAYRLLEQFRETRRHFAVVVDEYGSIQGIITMDDVLDALVGDVSEEFDQGEYQIIQRDENSWLADAQYPYFELLHYFDLSDEENPGDFSTIAGLVLHLTGRIPTAGHKVRWKNFEIEVIDMDGLRIDKLMITRVYEDDED